MSGSNAKVACQQCSETYKPEDLKEVYDEQLEICGFICNPCCIKSAEYARRCQISDCKTKPDCGPTGFRTLPSKFYDLGEGEVKRRIIKQFGIFRNVRACCNMCYVRISKSIVQMKIVYGDGLPRNSKLSPNKASKPVAQNSLGDKAILSRDDRLSQYTGPKFTRRSGSTPCWEKSKVQTEENIVPSNVGEILGHKNDFSDDKTRSLNGDNKMVDNPELARSVLDAKSKDSERASADVDNEMQKNDVRDVAPSDRTDMENNLGKTGVSDGHAAGFRYSSTPISPTSMRFRRIQPKIARFDEFDLSNEAVDGTDADQLLRRKRSKGNDDETWSPIKPKKEKAEGRGAVVKKNPLINTNVMSDFVSCAGCHKICSSKETVSAFDEKKGINIRLCYDCEKSSANAGKERCPVKGCTTPLDGIIPVQISANIHGLDDATMKTLSEIGVNKETKACCKHCWNRVSEMISRKEKIKEKIDNEDHVFTMCRNCCKIVPMKSTSPNIEENGRKCGVLCQLCSGGKDRVLETTGKKDQKALKKTRVPEQNLKTIGFCKAKGCVHAGEKEPIQLVSGKKILKNYLDEKMLRAEFDLADDMDYCCRSCHARIKWFVADIKKRESGIGADSKNSLKNLTPKGKSEDEKIKKEKQIAHQVSKEDSKSLLIKQEKAGLNEVPLDCNNVAMAPLMVDDREMPIKLENDNETLGTLPAKDVSKNETLLVKNIASFQTPQLSSLSSKTAIIIPPVNATSSGHPSVLHVGGQQFVLNVISRCDKECQTNEVTDRMKQNENFSAIEKGVQVNIPLMPKFEGTVPANLPNGKKVKYIDAKEKTKYAVKRAGKDLLDQFLQQLDEISGGCAQQLLSDIYRSKEVVMAANYEKILSSIGMLYQNSDKSNRQERLRLLSTVALHAPNETLKRFFQRSSKKGDLISVNEAEIVQAREYAKQFGPGTHVMPIGQVSWKNFASGVIHELADDNESNENEAEYVNEVESTIKVDHEIDGVQEKAPSLTNLQCADNDADGRLSPDIPVLRKDGEKQFITLEKMRNVESRPIENGGEQLVTFKVTVRHAKEKGNIDGNEVIKAMPPSKHCEGASDGDTQESRKEGTDDKNSKRMNEDDRTNVAKRRKKKSTGSLENSEANEKKKIKRKSVEIQPREIPKKDVDGSKGENSGDAREKRTRTAFNYEKKSILEQYFEKNIYASKATVEEISRELGIDKKKIDNWFRNRRSKLKKDEEEKSKRNVELKTRKGKKNVTTDGNSAGENCTETSVGVLSEQEDTEKESKDKEEQKSENDTNDDIEKVNENIQNDETKIEKRESNENETSEGEVNDDRADGMKEQDGCDLISLKQEHDMHGAPYKDGTKSTQMSRVNDEKTRIKNDEVDENGKNDVKIADKIENTREEKEAPRGKNEITSTENEIGLKDEKKEEEVLKYVASESKQPKDGSTKEGSNLQANGCIEGKEIIVSEGVAVGKVIRDEEKVDEERSDEKDNVQEKELGQDDPMGAEENYDGYDDKIGEESEAMDCVENNIAESKGTVPKVDLDNKNENVGREEQMPVQRIPTAKVAEDFGNCKEFPFKARLLSRDRDDAKGRSESVVQKSWSSISEGSTFSMGVIDGYEVENGEPNVGDDLALALNNDPDFMKDLSELMSIAKT